MAISLLNQSKSRSLSAQIRDAERQVSNRRQQVDKSVATLALKTRRQMTAPATLLMASGLGFIVGEFTKCQPQKFRDTADTSQAAETTPLSIALSLITSARTLYAALPLFWIVKSYFQPQTPVRQRQPTPLSQATQHEPESRYS